MNSRTRFCEDQILKYGLHYPEYLKSTNIKEEYFVRENQVGSGLPEPRIDILRAILDSSSSEEILSKIVMNEPALALTTSLLSEDTEYNANYDFKIIVAYVENLLEDYRNRTVFEIYKNALESEPTRENRDIIFNRLKELEDLQALPLEKQDEMTVERLQEIKKRDRSFLECRKFKELFKTLAIRKNDTVAIAAPTGGGKSAFLINLASEFLKAGENVIYMNLEMAEEVVVERIEAILTGIEPEKIPANRLNDSEKEKLKQVDRLLVNGNFHLYNGDITVETLKEHILMALSPNFHNIILIDHLGCIETTDKTLKTTVDKLTYNAKEIRKISRDLGITIFEACQMNREATKKGGDMKTTNSLKGSSEIEQSATHVVTLTPYEINVEPSKAEPLYKRDGLEITILKNRNGIVGRSYICEYKKTTQEIKEIEEKK